jgi:uncharacterized protein (TIGR02118 family)
MTVEAFREHWRTRHAPLIVRLPGIRGYVQNSPLGGGEPLYDAVAESSFDDTQAMKALARTAEYAAVLEDEPRFIDRASMGSVITEEHVLKDGGPRSAALKTLTFVKRDAGTPVDDFFRALVDEGKRAATAPGVVRYVQCHARRSIYETGRTPAYDAFAMAWTERPDAAGDAGSLVVAERVVL